MHIYAIYSIKLYRANNQQNGKYIVRYATNTYFGYCILQNFNINLYIYSYLYYNTK